MNLWSGFLSEHVIDRALNIRYGLCSINTVRTLFVCLFVSLSVSLFVWLLRYPVLTAGKKCFAGASEYL